MKAGPKAQADLSPLPWTPRSRGAEQLRLFCEKFLKVPRGKGAKGPLRLRPWQVDLAETLYADETATAVWVLPRGNGKSGMAAAIGLHHVLMSGIEGARCAVIAQDDRSAKRLLSSAVRMVELDEDLASRCVVYRDRIVVPGTGSEFLALPAEAHRVEGEDLTLAILDEVGFMPTDTFEAAYLSTGKREGSKVLCIGTPSQSKWREKSPLWDLVIRGRAEPDSKTFRLVEYGADPKLPIDDPATWEAANPAYGDWLTEAALREQCSVVREAEFRRARLGQWVEQSTEPAFPVEKWRACERAGVFIPDGSKVVIALDGSKNGDSTGLLVGSVSSRPHFQVGGVWDPADHPDGWEVPILEVEDRICELCKQYHVVEIAADPYLWQRTLQVLVEEGLPAYSFPQSPQRQTPATADLRGAVNAGLLTHSGEAVLNRHVLRASIEETTRGIKLAKPSKHEHIDLAVCLMMCHSRASWLGSPKRLRAKKLRGIK